MNIRLGANKMFNIVYKVDFMRLIMDSNLLNNFEKLIQFINI